MRDSAGKGRFLGGLARRGNLFRCARGGSPSLPLDRSLSTLPGRRVRGARITCRWVWTELRPSIGHWLGARAIFGSGGQWRHRHSSEHARQTAGIPSLRRGQSRRRCHSAPPRRASRGRAPERTPHRPAATRDRRRGGRNEFRPRASRCAPSARPCVARREHSLPVPRRTSRRSRADAERVGNNAANDGKPGPRKRNRVRAWRSRQDRWRAPPERRGPVGGCCPHWKWSGPPIFLAGAARPGGGAFSRA